MDVNKEKVELNTTYQSHQAILLRVRSTKTIKMKSKTKFHQSEWLHIWRTGVGPILMCQNFLLNLLVQESTKARWNWLCTSGFDMGEDSQGKQKAWLSL